MLPYSRRLARIHCYQLLVAEYKHACSGQAQEALNQHPLTVIAPKASIGALEMHLFNIMVKHQTLVLTCD